ncbi:hypothetical protein [Pelagimonas varians]|uniref:Sigma-70, region 4 n=1 Tax=Pelagimonas varians TaxID=696760 RepID=A0A238K161_9RHOB|nr:hypothetical protein [Pelagimonas varians]PYG33106.1 hypothetical protein C8N36_102101 [Pelagimonas varians]SMX35696.1 Sigma-70, region 4 [Pelagimonas varians]
MLMLREQKQRFQELYGKGQIDGVIAKDLGVSGHQVRAHRTALGLPSVLDKFRWSTEQVETLSGLIGDGKTAAEIAKAMDLPATRVRAKAAQKGWSITVDADRKPYSAIEDEVLRNSLTSGVTIGELSQRLGRSRGSIRSRLEKLRDAAKVPDVVADSKLPPSPKPLTPAQVRLRDRLEARFDQGLIAALFGLRFKRGLSGELSELAERHGLTIRQVQLLWHQVRAA